MNKLKVTEIYGFEPANDMYIVDFYRTDGKTMAIILNDFGTLEEYLIDDIKIDYHNFIINN